MYCPYYMYGQFFLGIVFLSVLISNRIFINIAVLLHYERHLIKFAKQNMTKRPFILHNSSSEEFYKITGKHL